MKNLKDNQVGASHIILIVVFLVAFAGIVGFVYDRISQKSDQQATETSQTDEDAANDDTEGTDDVDVNDPTAGMDEEA